MNFHEKKNSYNYNTIKKERKEEGRIKEKLMTKTTCHMLLCQTSIEQPTEDGDFCENPISGPHTTFWKLLGTSTDK